jgi:hypothetical protein
MTTTRCFLTLVLLWQLAVLPARAHSADDAQAVAEEMAAAANHLLATLTTEQGAKATYPLADNERFNWHFVPRERKGLPFKDPGAKTLGARAAEHGTEPSRLLESLDDHEPRAGAA